MRGQWYRAQAGEAMEHEDLFHASQASALKKRYAAWRRYQDREDRRLVLRPTISVLFSDTLHPILPFCSQRSAKTRFDRKTFGSATVGDRGGNQRGANAWNLVELLARFVGTVASVDHAVELQDRCLEHSQLSAEHGDKRACDFRHPFVFWIGNDPQQVLDTFRLTGATMMSRYKVRTNLRLRRSVPRVYRRQTDAPGFRSTAAGLHSTFTHPRSLLI